MSYCTNPKYTCPKNAQTAQFCQTCGTPLRLKNRYRPLRKIGKGGFGRTFLAIDEDIPSCPRCVVKQLYFQTEDTQLQQKIVDLFHQEAVRLDELGDRPQIPQLLAHFEWENRLYLVQEWIDGRSLERELKKDGPFSEAKIWQLLEQILPVLEFIHQHQIVHRDIKPANIMRRATALSDKTTDRILPELVLIDFGIAKVCAPHLQPKTGTIIGSPEYMAPEQHRGKVFPATDLYALGATCVRLLTNTSPVELFDIVRDCWRWRDYLPADVQVSDRLGAILDKLLKNALSQRYQSARAVLNDLTPPKPRTQLALSRRLQRPQKPSFWQRFSRSPQSTELVPDAELRSALGLDYTTLRSLLKRQKWADADRETRQMLCRAASKPANGYLHGRELDRVPCEDLQTIDRLWMAYSDGRFGWSVQRNIYEACDRDYVEFCDRVGWSVSRPTSGDRNLQFHRNARTGHLPSRSWVGGLQWRSHVEAMAQKLEKCDRE
ncbi:MAG: serine/threonine-protein kinase [Cyanobacteriota bacterium]|nr:serine/threonine-protein kinase [Cyanobacteriota bacterium]